VSRPDGATRNDSALVARYEPYPTDGAPIVSALSPVRTPVIDGAVFHDDQALGRLTPVVSWQAPVEPGIVQYRLTVYRLARGATGSLERAEVGSAYTLISSLRLPPGVLQAGGFYYFQVSAFRRNAADGDRLPLQLTLPVARADTLSGVLRVP
jgi:hypothetical protein